MASSPTASDYEIYDESQTFPKEIDSEPCAGSHLPPGCSGAEQFKGMESFERKLSCHEVQKLLDMFTALMETPVNLPENKGSVFECRLHKNLEKEDAMKTIDDKMDKVLEWVEKVRESMKQHLASHRFSVDYKDESVLRNRGNENKRADSGIGSQDITSLKIDSVMTFPPDPEGDQASESGDDTRSWDCNCCYCFNKSCKCNSLSQEEKRNNPRSKRSGITSISQIPENPKMETPKLSNTRQVLGETLENISSHLCSACLKPLNIPPQPLDSDGCADSQNKATPFVGEVVNPFSESKHTTPSAPIPKMLQKSTQPENLPTPQKLEKPDELEGSLSGTEIDDLKPPLSDEQLESQVHFSTTQLQNDELHTPPAATQFEGVNILPLDRELEEQKASQNGTEQVDDKTPGAATTQPERFNAVQSEEPHTGSSATQPDTSQPGELDEASTQF